MPTPDIFRPDIFSDPAPVFHALEGNTEEAGDISALFARHFKTSGAAPRAIWKSGGIEVNSRNFRVDADDGRYLLKKLALTPGEKITIENQQSLLAWLYDKGIPAPRPIRSRENTYLCVTGKNDCWTAMSFVEGRFFEGGAASVENAGRAIGRLHRTLQTAPAELALDRRYIHLSDDDARLFEEALTNEHAKLRPFGDADASLLVQNSKLLRQAWLAVCKHREVFRSAESGLIHMDLHPHNMLMQGDQVAAFLDFNSLKTGPLNMMLGFSAYKLLRQSVQHTDPGMSAANCRMLTDKYLKSYFDEFPEHAAPSESIGYFALAEVCRRIGVIFRLTLRQGNTTWNHVLKMHLAGIREIGRLFDLEYET